MAAEQSSQEGSTLLHLSAENHLLVYISPSLRWVQGVSDFPWIAIWNFQPSLLESPDMPALFTRSAGPSLGIDHVGF